jgi:hypothetical protein
LKYLILIFLLFCPACGTWYGLFTVKTQYIGPEEKNCHTVYSKDNGYLKVTFPDGMVLEVDNRGNRSGYELILPALLQKSHDLDKKD